MELAEPIRTAIVGNAGITTNLPSYLGSFTVFTRRPVPADALYPMIVISSGLQMGEADGLTDQRPMHVRDVIVYGSNEEAVNYRLVETLAESVKDLFHRLWRSITVPGWKVVEIVASGPAPAPTDDEQTVGRMVELAITLAKENV